MQYIFGQKAGTRVATLFIALALLLAPLSAKAENSSKPEANNAPVSIASNPLTWQHNYKQALNLASSQSKLVLIDLYTDWCGWCKKLDRDTYTNSDVQTFLNKQFVLLKLNAEDGGDGEAVAKKFQVRGYPCTIIMDSRGKPKGVIYGFYSAKEYPTEVTKAMNNG